MSSWNAFPSSSDTRDWRYSQVDNGVSGQTVYGYLETPYVSLETPYVRDYLGAGSSERPRYDGSGGLGRGPEDQKQHRFYEGHPRPGVQERVPLPESRGAEWTNSGIHYSVPTDTGREMPPYGYGERQSFRASDEVVQSVNTDRWQQRKALHFMEPAKQVLSSAVRDGSAVRALQPVGDLQRPPKVRRKSRWESVDPKTLKPATASGPVDLLWDGMRGRTPGSSTHNTDSGQSLFDSVHARPGAEERSWTRRESPSLVSRPDLPSQRFSGDTHRSDLPGQYSQPQKYSVGPRFTSQSVRDFSEMNGNYDWNDRPHFPDDFPSKRRRHAPGFDRSEVDPLVIGGDGRDAALAQVVERRRRNVSANTLPGNSDLQAALPSTDLKWGRRGVGETMIPQRLATQIREPMQHLPMGVESPPRLTTVGPGPPCPASDGGRDETMARKDLRLVQDLLKKWRTEHAAAASEVKHLEDELNKNAQAKVKSLQKLAESEQQLLRELVSVGNDGVGTLTTQLSDDIRQKQDNIQLQLGKVRAMKEALSREVELSGSASEDLLKAQTRVRDLEENIQMMQEKERNLLGSTVDPVTHVPGEGNTKSLPMVAETNAADVPKPEDVTDQNSEMVQRDLQRNLDDIRDLLRKWRTQLAAAVTEVKALEEDISARLQSKTRSMKEMEASEEELVTQLRSIESDKLKAFVAGQSDKRIKEKHQRVLQQLDRVRARKTEMSLANAERCRPQNERLLKAKTRIRELEENIETLQQRERSMLNALAESFAQ